MTSLTTKWCVYMILCSDDSLYTGISNDVNRRFLQHQQNKGAKYFRSHAPVKIVYIENEHTRVTASQREYKIKQLTHTQKLSLVNSQQNQIETKSEIN
ncbi:MAG: GIY-YIG nuclease family protein [Gammaproteobacteria bacterium]|nr:GIY-YIG nuclease family protein [Gammaproteobacteria bacterium]